MTHMRARPDVRPLPADTVRGLPVLSHAIGKLTIQEILDRGNWTRGMISRLLVPVGVMDAARNRYALYRHFVNLYDAATVEGVERSPEFAAALSRSFKRVSVYLPAGIVSIDTGLGKMELHVETSVAVYQQGGSAAFFKVRNDEARRIDYAKAEKQSDGRWALFLCEKRRHGKVPYIGFLERGARCKTLQGLLNGRARWILNHHVPKIPGQPQYMSASSPDF